MVICRWYLVEVKKPWRSRRRPNRAASLRLGFIIWCLRKSLAELRATLVQLTVQHSIPMEKSKYSFYVSWSYLLFGQFVELMVTAFFFLLLQPNNVQFKMLKYLTSLFRFNHCLEIIILCLILFIDYTCHSRHFDMIE